MNMSAVSAAFAELSAPKHGLVVGIVSADGVVASAAREVDEDSVFYIASVSKAFAAMSLMIAGGRGLMALDDDVRVFVPELPPWAAGTTVRHLLWHTAGLPDYQEFLKAAGIDPHGDLTDELILEVLAAQLAPVVPPGTTFAYSNTGYWLLGVALGRATGTTLRLFADEHIFGPLGMSRTWFRDDYREQTPKMAVGHVAPGVPHPASRFDRVGDGGVVSTLQDLSRWESAVLRHEEPWHGLVEQISTPVPLHDGSVPSWRAGVVLEEVHGHPAVLLGGTFLGYRAFGARLPDKHFAVYALADLETADVRSAVFRVISAALAEG